MAISDFKSVNPFLDISRIRNAQSSANVQYDHVRKVTMSVKPKVVVVGAGAFGSWIALHLLRRGARVLLLDAWGPGNSRASSGGETRVLRCTYGLSQPYTKMVMRARQLWEEHERLCGRRLLHAVGVLWMARSGTDDFER